MIIFKNPWWLTDYSQITCIWKIREFRWYHLFIFKSVNYEESFLTKYFEIKIKIWDVLLSPAEMTFALLTLKDPIYNGVC